MPRHRIGDDWSIELADEFCGRMVDGCLQFVRVGPPVRTVWACVWESAGQHSPAETFEIYVLPYVPADPVERFEAAAADDTEVRYASWYPETQDGRTIWGLNAYTIRRESYVQISFYAEQDDAGARAWALCSWHTLRFERR